LAYKALDLNAISHCKPIILGNGEINDIKSEHNPHKHMTGLIPRINKLLDRISAY